MNPFPARRSTTLANLPASTPLWAFSALRIKAFDQPDRQKLVYTGFPAALFAEPSSIRQTESFREPWN
jgi:hypothetical protein